MKKTTANKIIALNNNNSLPYCEKILAMQELVGDKDLSHKNFMTSKLYGKRNQCLLEAYRVLKDFKSDEWIFEKDIAANDIIKGQPIKFSIVTKENKQIDYVLYNKDQIYKYNNAADSVKEKYTANESIKRYTANYSYTNSNFVIQNIKNSICKNELYPTICVLKNIIQRGNPTLMSQFLQEKLGQIQDDENFSFPYPLIDKMPANWNYIIKGCEEENLYPARDFYYNNIPNDLPDCKFIQNLILPEASILEITQDQTKESEEFIEQHVDFYIPQIKLAIEIDGSQHEEKSQKILDLKRDEFLLKHQIETIRITTKELKNTSCQSYKDKLLKIRQKITDLYYVQKNTCEKTNIKIDDYKNAYTNKINLENKNYIATAIIRFQVLILEMLQRKVLSFEKEWNIEIYSHEIQNFAHIAIDDLFIWFEHLFSLRGIKIKKPEINIKYIDSPQDFSLTDSAKVDFSILKRYTDENLLNRNIYYVRTDYFDDRNYFEVSTANIINYNTSPKKAEKNLLFLAWNLFLQNNKNLSFKNFKFREGQLDIIVNAINRRHTIGLLPTGSGKSICYQLSCLLQPSIAFVVCPIKSLMVDQVQDLCNAHITNIDSITSDNTLEDKNKIQKNYQNGKYFFIFISPERFQNKNFRTYIANVDKKYKISYAVIDEAHCLSEWGHDFRTSYLNLVNAIKKLSTDFRFIALSATASSNVLKDLKIELELQEEDDIKTPKEYCRKELEFDVKSDNGNKYETLEQLIDNFRAEDFYKDKAGIVFTPLKNSNKQSGMLGCCDLAAKLQKHLQEEEKNIEVPFYSGEEPRNYNANMQFTEYKKMVQDGFKHNKFSLLATTKAFGMGVNKGNIGYTIHYGIPASMESLYQEAGRAGREKTLFKTHKAQCIVLLSPTICSENNNNDDYDPYDKYNQYASKNISEDELVKLWDKASDYSIIKSISNNLNNDLSTQVFFFISGVNDIEEDLAILRKLYIDIVNANLKTLLIEKPQKYLSDRRADFEKYIFKLKQLGIVLDWTVDFAKNQFELILGNLDIKSIKCSIENTIRKYESEFSFDLLKQEQSRYEKLQQIYKENENEFDRYVKVLLQWNYDTFAYSRRQSLKTVYETCLKTAKKELTSEEFKNTIENYFRFSNKANILQHIADEPLDYKVWFDVLYVFQDSIKTDKIISKKDAQELVATLSRFLESYMQNTGLDFISGICRLILDDYDNADGRNRFVSSLKQIKNFDSTAIDYIVKNLFIILKTLDKNKRNIISKEIINIFKIDKNFLFQMYNELNDNNSLVLISKEFLARVNNINEKIKV